MPRVARIVIPGMTCHVTQPGNNRQRVFFSDAQRRLYLTLLREEAGRFELHIQGWCLMDNHIHLIAVPQRADSMAKALGRAHFKYTQHFNRAQHRSGHLWQNRFFSCLLEGAHYWSALRYVERNPVRAGLAARAWDWPWSSAAAHAGRGEDSGGLLDLADWVARAGGLDWARELRRGEVEADLEDLRRHTQTGRPLASNAFLDDLERQMQRRLRPLPVGRPRKTPNKDQEKEK